MNLSQVVAAAAAAVLLPGVLAFNTHAFSSSRVLREEIVVAVIDSGLDTSLPFFKNKVWTNLKEIPGNSKDDDLNGYVDDTHGWDFLRYEAEEKEGGVQGKKMRCCPYKRTGWYNF